MTDEDARFDWVGASWLLKHKQLGFVFIRTINFTGSVLSHLCSLGFIGFVSYGVIMMVKVICGGTYYEPKDYQHDSYFYYDAVMDFQLRGGTAVMKYSFYFDLMSEDGGIRIVVSMGL